MIRTAAKALARLVLRYDLEANRLDDAIRAAKRERRTDRWWRLLYRFRTIDRDRWKERAETSIECVRGVSAEMGRLVKQRDEARAGAAENLKRAEVAEKELADRNMKLGYTSRWFCRVEKAEAERDAAIAGRLELARDANDAWTEHLSAGCSDAAVQAQAERACVAENALGVAGADRAKAHAALRTLRAWDHLTPGLGGDVPWARQVIAAGLGEPMDAFLAAIPKPHNMAAPNGPECQCGKPSTHESGWCGECVAGPFGVDEADDGQ